MILKDSGNRTDMAGTGANRDLNPENGRCDLIPGSVLKFYISHLVHKEANGATPQEQCIMQALENIFDFMDTKESVKLERALENLSSALALPHNNVSTPFSLGNMILEVSQQYKDGANKYGDRNWEKGLPLSSFIDSAIRHLSKALIGMEDEPHIRAGIWNVIGALFTLDNRPELDNMPNYRGGYSSDTAKKED